MQIKELFNFEDKYKNKSKIKDTKNFIKKITIHENFLKLSYKS